MCEEVKKQQIKTTTRAHFLTRLAAFLKALGVPSAEAGGCAAEFDPNTNAGAVAAGTLLESVKLKLGGALKLNPTGSVVGLLNPPLGALSPLVAPKTNIPPLLLLFVLLLVPKLTFCLFSLAVVLLDENSEKVGTVAVALFASPNLKVPAWLVGALLLLPKVELEVIPNAGAELELAAVNAKPVFDEPKIDAD